MRERASHTHTDVREMRETVAAEGTIGRTALGLTFDLKPHPAWNLIKHLKMFNLAVFLSVLLSLQACGASDVEPIYVASNSSASTNRKRIFFVRHGQAYHNIDHCNKHPDAPLTGHGRLQAQKINCSISECISPDLILFSPLRRTVETLLESYAHMCQQGNTQCLPIADLQENWNGEHGFDCDTGSPPAMLSEQFPMFNFSSLPENWMIADSHLPQSEKIRVRHERVRLWLSSRPERVILIVAHHGTIKGLLGMTHGIENGDTIEISLDVEQKSFVWDSSHRHHVNSVSCLPIQCESL